MKQVLDLHIHSPYSRACSPKITLQSIDKTCREKGVDIISTGDFTHPEWFKKISTDLEEVANGNGLYKIKGSDGRVKFIISSEVSLIYKDKGKVRRIHLVVHAPNIESVRKLNSYLDKRFNIRSDGRPILGIKAPEFVSLLLKINPHFLVYPAHIWTPWFSVFGSKSGFDSLEECFGGQTKHIYAIETGLSSDPEMNWRLSQLDKLTFLSSSDAHSLGNIAREATVMDIKGAISYQKIYNIIKNKTKQKEGEVLYTIEFYPEEGMYYADGHRDCNFKSTPKESKKLDNICPVCHKTIVIGVLNRVEELADRPLNYKPKNAPFFKKIIELDKIIKDSLGIKSRKSLKVQAEYKRLISCYGSELNILLDLDLELMKEKSDKKIKEGIIKMRQDKLLIKPGFDGQYGQIKIF